MDVRKKVQGVPMKALRALALSLCIAVGMLGAGAARAADVMVFAAASLTDVLNTLARRYAEKSADVIRFSFAASSSLARQVEAGAPADIFISANEDWMDYLADRKLIVPGSRTSLLGNTLVMIAPQDSPLSTVEIKPGMDIASVVGSGNRLATGDPAHVPVGIYAQQAFESLGIWNVAEPLLARSDSVRSALALVERGEAPLGIVYGTDAMASKGVRVVATFPEQTHSPISYPFAIVAGRDQDAVRGFFAYLISGEGAKTYESYGFVWLGPTG